MRRNKRNSKRTQAGESARVHPDSPRRGDVYFAKPKQIIPPVLPLIPLVTNPTEFGKAVENAFSTLARIIYGVCRK